MQIKGPARVDRRTKDLVKRLGPNDIAVIDHIDLDQVAAESLVKTRVRAVVNASPSISGRYPNPGPETLVQAGVFLLDNAGPEIMDHIQDGDDLEIIGNALFARGNYLASGTPLTSELIQRSMQLAQENLASELDKFVQNTLEYAMREKELILGGIQFPVLRTPIRGRQALVVVRGHHYRDDLSAIKSYILEVRPVLIGVDGGADALLEFGYRPDIIVGDMDSITDNALRCGAELVVHAYRDGRAPGLARLEELGLKPLVVPAPGTSEDVALLMAFDNGATLIVAVGTHSNMIDFLDKGRKGMASTFLVRLKVGSILVDARGVSRLYRGRVQARYFLLIALAAGATILAVVSVSEPIRQYLALLWLKLRLALGL